MDIIIHAGLGLGLLTIGMVSLATLIRINRKLSVLLRGR